MNLTNLFDIQRQLDERIIKEHGLEGQDLLPKKIVALQVELGELANEWRGFKFWSKDRNPRIDKKVHCHACHGKGDMLVSLWDRKRETCGYCDGTGWQEDRNPLLEEYVDCLHFILSIGLELKINIEPFSDLVYSNYPHDITETFVYLNRRISDIFESLRFNPGAEFHFYRIVCQVFIGLGIKLGFTWEQIEQAYLDKNKINHERQEAGY